MTTPSPPAPERVEQSLPGRIVAVTGVILSAVYLLNPGMGVFELLPDNLPIVGNLDEAAATGLIVFGLRYLGLGLRRRKKE